MEKTYTKEELFDEIVCVMGDLFEVDTEGVTRESRLVEDLDLDSIDAVDMIVHLQNMIGKTHQARGLQVRAHGGRRRRRHLRLLAADAEAAN